MITSHGFAALQAGAKLEPYTFERREPRAHDVCLDVLYCGVCHSDIHQIRDEWSGGIFPMVPGHEIVGRITKIGEAVSKFEVGDVIGVGCMIDSCRRCTSCQTGLEQYCEEGFVATYNALEKDGKTVTYGGYSSNLVVDEAFALRIPPSLHLPETAPLLCAGITTYSPLRHWATAPGKVVGVVGFGGLGHMAVKLAHAMGARVVLFTGSPGKTEDAKNMGADEVLISKNAHEIQQYKGRFDLILDTVSAPHDINAYTALLRRDGVLVLLGLPDRPPQLETSSLIFNRTAVSGSLIGGIRETQEMLDFCAEHNIASTIEVIPINRINEAYQRVLRSDVRYRFVIDMTSLTN